MNAQLPELIIAMVKLGLRHNAIAHSLGLTLPVLRQYFTLELIQTATEAEMAALAALQAMTTSPPQHRCAALPTENAPPSQAPRKRKGTLSIPSR